MELVLAAGEKHHINKTTLNSSNQDISQHINN